MDERTHDDLMLDYYNERAFSMADVYRQKKRTIQDSLSMVSDMQIALTGRKVLEVASGTGYWTAVAAEVAEHVTATDLAPNMMIILRTSVFAPGKSSVELADAFSLQNLSGEFDSGLAVQWISHVLLSRLNAFFTGWHRRLGSGSVVFIADSVKTEDDSEELVKMTSSDDTYERRILPDGKEFLIVKNYFDENWLREILTPFACDIKVRFERQW
jgi:Methylase involved in ubiquinone/menaquinone biosynthesis